VDTHLGAMRVVVMKERQERLLAFVGVVIGLELCPPPAVPPQLLGKRLLRQQASPAGTFGQLRPLA
jgi:hypothetical protein